MIRSRPDRSAWCLNDNFSRRREKSESADLAPRTSPLLMSAASDRRSDRSKRRRYVVRGIAGGLTLPPPIALRAPRSAAGVCVVGMPWWGVRLARRRPNAFVRMGRRALFGKPMTDAERQRRRRWGGNPKDYRARAAAQVGVCAICGDVRALVHDHCHTKTARDLLCARCNTMLGFAQDDPIRLRAAADYLERHADPIK